MSLNDFDHNVALLKCQVLFSLTLRLIEARKINVIPEQSVSILVHKVPYRTNNFESACSEIFRKWILFKTGRNGHFSNRNIIQSDKIANVNLVCKQFRENNVYVTYYFKNSGNHIF